MTQMGRDQNRRPAIGRYFGGCRPGLDAHLSAFSLTVSWLGRTGGLESFGIFGNWIFLSMSDLLKPLRLRLRR